jgi:DNA-binding beta-propeller fold protein YncE
VTNFGSNNVTKLNLSGTTAGTFAVGTSPLGIAFDGAHLWVANHGNNSVTELSLTGAHLGTFSVGNDPWGVAFDGANVWVANQFFCCAAGTVSKL